MERNVTKSSTLGPGDRPFDVQAARVATTIHDAFDGHTRWGFGWPQDAPGNGNIWKRKPLELYEFANTNLGDVRAGDAGDEPVVLPGSAFKDFIQRAAFTDTDMMQALADTIKDHGYDWCQTCQVFAPHDEKLKSDSLLDRYAVCEQQPIATWLRSGPDPQLPQSCNFAGCPDGSIPNYGTNTCVPCPAGQVEVEGTRCEACPQGTTVVDNSCQICDGQGSCTAACPGRTQLVNGACQDCPWEQVQVNGVCQPCPAGLLRQDNQCVAQCSGCDATDVIDRGVCTCVVL
jgi:hypothetical protein